MASSCDEDRDDSEEDDDDEASHRRQLLPVMALDDLLVVAATDNSGADVVAVVVMAPLLRVTTKANDGRNVHTAAISRLPVIMVRPYISIKKWMVYLILLYERLRRRAPCMHCTMVVRLFCGPQENQRERVCVRHRGAAGAQKKKSDAYCFFGWIFRSRSHFEAFCAFPSLFSASHHLLALLIDTLDGCWAHSTGNQIINLYFLDEPASGSQDNGRPGIDFWRRVRTHNEKNGLLTDGGFCQQ